MTIQSHIKKAALRILIAILAVGAPLLCSCTQTLPASGFLKEPAKYEAETATVYGLGIVSLNIEKIPLGEGMLFPKLANKLS